MDVIPRSRLLDVAPGLVLALILGVILALNGEGVGSWVEFVTGRFDDIVELTIEHLQLVLLPVVLATFVSVGLGILTHRSVVARNVALTIAAVLLTIPSLALFALFIPIFGLGYTSAAIALFLYAILPILRNTITGLNEVDPAVLEAAQGMGMSNVQRLLRVKLPLAWPVIVTGVRVSTTLTVSIAAIATLVAAGGLGDFIKDGLARFPLPTSVERLYAGTVSIILVALVLDLAFILLRRVTTSPGLEDR